MRPPVQAQQLTIEEHRGGTTGMQLTGSHGGGGLHAQHEQAVDHEPFLLICKAGPAFTLLVS